MTAPLTHRSKKHTHKRKSGLLPGTAIYTGNKHPENISISRIDYSEQHFSEKSFTQGDNIPMDVTDNNIMWLNVNGLNIESLIEKIGVQFKLHNLIVEDILNVYQIPKADEYPESDIIYITLNEFYFDEADGCLKGDKWNVFWYGLENFDQIKYAVDHCRARPATLKG